jgi:quercetin dioxygenase-like cupin family protein
MKRHLIAAAVALVVSLSGALAQEKPTESKPLLENERMKVFEIQFKPGARTTTLSHAGRFVYALTDGSLVFSPAGKTPYELSFAAGEALWLPAETMATVNDTQKDVRALVVELKDARRSASPPAPQGVAKARGKRSGRRR